MVDSTVALLLSLLLDEVTVELRSVDVDSGVVVASRALLVIGEVALNDKVVSASVVVVVAELNDMEVIPVTIVGL